MFYFAKYSNVKYIDIVTFQCKTLLRDNEGI